MHGEEAKVLTISGYMVEKQPSSSSSFLRFYPQFWFCSSVLPTGLLPGYGLFCWFFSWFWLDKFYSRFAVIQHRFVTQSFAAFRSLRYIFAAFVLKAFCWCTRVNGRLRRLNSHYRNVER